MTDIDDGSCLGITLCEREGWHFPEVFKGQFRFTRSVTAPCKEWKTRRLGPWYLHHCPDLPCHDLCLASGQKIGALLGVGVDADGVVVDGETRLSGVSDLAALERYIETLAGRFIVISDFLQENRIYFDPSGGLSAVFSAKDKAVASSVHVLIDRALEPNENVDARQVLARKEQYLLGETCDRHCQRIRANHYLDLTSFELVRHWPRADEEFSEQGFSRAAAVEKIATRLEQIMAALTSGFRTGLPVSGGADSRILLAAGRDCLNQIDRFYIHDVYKVTQFDRLAGARLARHLGIPYQVIDRKAPGFWRLDDDELSVLRRKMALRTSMSFDGIDDVTTRAVALAPRVELVLRGNMAEMTRANKWDRHAARHGVTPETGLGFLTGLDRDELRKKWSSERYEMMLERYGSWMDSLPDPAHQRIPDMAHIEVFAPAAPNNVYYAFDRSFYINPFNDRQIFHQTMRFHPIARMKRKLVNGLIGRCMPDIVDLPYVSYYKALFREAEEKGIILRPEL